MAESRYEQYVIRRPALIKQGVEVPVDKVDTEGKSSTGPMVWCSRDMVANSSILLETGIIWGEGAAGTGGPNTFKPHKHEDFDEIFTWVGTDPSDPMDLGMEAEFWLGEGETLDKVIINRSMSVYVPAGLGHFPLVVKKVTRPCIMVVVAATPYKRGQISAVPVDMKGRPV
jgi:hypothetical protein